jgi:hypothetical protein
MPTPRPNAPAAALRSAAALTADGRHAEAAQAYAALAAEAERVRNRRRAANTHASAALAFVAAGDAAAALVHARAALGEFLALRLYHRAPSFYQAVAKAAESRRATRLLDALRTEFSAQVVVFTAESRKDALPASRLPAACPGCGLPMRADVVDWITDARAECDYCGTVMDATP